MLPDKLQQLRTVALHLVVGSIRIGVPFSVARISPGGYGSARCPTLNERCLTGEGAALEKALTRNLTLRQSSSTF
jgi:hypothetical protein